MQMLDSLVTDKTEIIELEPCLKSKEEKLSVMDLNHSIAPNYVANMYIYNGIWHYFKTKTDEDSYYYSIPDELVGSKLAHSRGLKTVSYKIARANGTLGIVSPNFKQANFKYELLSEILGEDISYKDPLKLELLLSFTRDSNNRESFERNIFNLFALDIHMLQKDRADVNLQFQTDIETGYFDLAPVYDFATCSKRVGAEGINIPSKITRLDYLHIISLARRNPVFKEALEFIQTEDMVNTWKEVCEENNFNLNSPLYTKILTHYEEKEYYQKRYIKELLSRV